MGGTMSSGTLSKLAREYARPWLATGAKLGRLLASMLRDLGVAVAYSGSLNDTLGLLGTDRCGVTLILRPGPAVLGLLFGEGGC